MIRPAVSDPDHLLQPFRHLACGFVRESDGENRFGSYTPFLDEMGDAGGQRAGFASTRPSDDDEWSFGAGGGGALIFIQGFQRLDKVGAHPRRSPRELSDCDAW